MKMALHVLRFTRNNRYAHTLLLTVSTASVIQPTPANADVGLTILWLVCHGSAVTVMRPPLQDRTKSSNEQQKCKWPKTRNSLTKITSRHIGRTTQSRDARKRLDTDQREPGITISLVHALTHT